MIYIQDCRCSLKSFRKSLVLVVVPSQMLENWEWFIVEKSLILE